MANGVVQLKGTFKCCETGGALVDYSSVTSSARVTEKKATITRPAVLSTGESTTLAGETTRDLTVTFHSTTAAASMHAVLRAAINTASSLVDFEFIANDDAVSASNPRFTGTAMLPQLDTGNDVGALREQTITLPITTWNTPAVV
jgi:hypothetical protein